MKQPVRSSHGLWRDGARRAVAVAVLGVGGVACGGDELTVGGADATGHVGGILVDGATRAPLAGVAMSLVAGGRVPPATATAPDGSFGFTGVPAGDVLVLVEAPAEPVAYARAWIRGTLPAATGEYPAGNSTLTLGPIGLVPLTGVFAFRVLDPNGKPVADYTVGVQAQVEYVDFAGGVPDAHGEILYEATTDAQGYVTLAALPDYVGLGPSVPDAVLVFLPPYDGQGDGIYDFGGGDRVFNVRRLGDPTPDVILAPGFDTTLQVRASTIPDLVATSGVDTPALLPTSGTVHVAFNLPIQATADVTVVNEFGAGLAAAPTLAIRDDNLAIGFSGLAAGAEYNLAIHAVAAVGDRLVEGDFGGSFFTPAAGAASIAVATRDPISQIVRLTFDQPVGGIASTLSGSANCVVFFQADLDGAGGIGNAANELGSESCSVVLALDEVDPPGLVGPSGYATTWQLTAPLLSGGGAIPASTPVHLVFSRVADAARIVERPDGQPVADLMFMMP
jgi:hypothetical protein